MVPQSVRPPLRMLYYRLGKYPMNLIECNILTSVSCFLEFCRLAEKKTKSDKFTFFLDLTTAMIKKTDGHQDDDYLVLKY